MTVLEKQLLEALNTIQHSMLMAKTLGNDYRREIDLSLNVAVSAIEIAKAASTSTKPAPNYPDIPDGWKLVPKEPTDMMIGAALRHIDGMAAFPAAYRAMLAATPSPAQVGQPTYSSDESMRLTIDSMKRIGMALASYISQQKRNRDRLSPLHWADVERNSITQEISDLEPLCEFISCNVKLMRQQGNGVTYLCLKNCDAGSNERGE